jgi:glycosyltransferase involved in cell wall biosynthesis
MCVLVLLFRIPVAGASRNGTETLRDAPIDARLMPIGRTRVGDAGRWTVPKESPDVSVIIAVRNGAATLEQSIQSVLRQVDCRVELIVIDALSDDGTQQIVEAHASAISTYIREPDGGIYDAWNKGLDFAQGEWCAFLGSDDYYRNPTSIRTLLNCAQEPEVRPVFVWGGIVRTGSGSDYVVHPDPADALEFLRRRSMLPHPGFLHHVGTLERIGRFDDSFQIAGDLDAAFRLLQLGPATRCPEIVTVMRTGGISNQREHARRLHAERWRIFRRELGLLPAIYRTARPLVLRHMRYTLESMMSRLVGVEWGGRLILALRRRLRQRSSR